MNTIAQSTSTKLVAGIIAVVMFFSSFYAFVGNAHAQSNANVDIELICILAAQFGVPLGELQDICDAVLDASEDEDSATEDVDEQYVHHPSIDFEFTRNLKQGDRGEDVKMLQKVLNGNPNTVVASEGPGSPGNETEYYGPKTAAALGAFQEENEIVASPSSPGYGVCGPKTRGELNRTEVVEKETTDEESDNNDSNNEAAGKDELIVREKNTPRDELMPAGVVRFPVTGFEMKAGSEDVTVEKITVRYNGNAEPDEVVKSVMVTDANNNIIGKEKRLNSDDEADIKMGVTIEKGESMMFYVAVNAESGTDYEDNDGLSFTMDVVAVESDASDVDGLPVSGAEMEIQDNIDLGTVDVELKGTDTSFEVGEEDKLFVKIDIDSEADGDDSVFVKNIRLENTGNGDLDDLVNIHLEVDRKKYAGTVDENDEDFVVFDLGSGYELEDGDSEVFEVRADTGTTAGTYTFTIDESSDIYVESEAGYGMPINLLGATGPEITVGTGQVTLDDGEDEEAENITVGSDVVIGLFDLEVEGEAFIADKLNLEITVTNGDVVGGGDAQDLNLEDVYIADSNGNALTDKEDASGTPVLDTSFTIEVEFDDVQILAGDHKNLQIRADIDDKVDSGTEYEVTKLQFTGLEGVDSGDSITPSGSPDFKARKVEAAVLVVSMDSGEPSETDIAKDSDQVEVGVVELDARDSGEDIAVTEFTLTFGHSVTDPEEVENCRIYGENGSEVDLSNNVDIDTSTATSTHEFQFKDAYVVESDTKVDLSVRCDIGNNVGADGNFTWSIASSTADVDAEGVTTGNDDFAEVTTSSAKEITIVAASATVAKDSNTPDAQVVKLGSDDVVLGIIEVEAEDGDITIDDITFKLSNYQLLDSGDQINVYVGDVRQDSVDLNNATNTVENLNIDVAKDQRVEITFTADINSAETLSGTSTKLTVVNLVLEDGGKVNGISTTNPTSGTAVLLATPISFDTVTAYKAVPVLALESSVSNDLGSNSSQVEYELLGFSIKADGGDVRFGTVELDVTTFSNFNEFVGEMSVYEDENLSNEYGTDSKATTTISKTGIVTFNFSSDIKINDGDTYHLVVRGNVTATNAPANITLELREDADGVQFVDEDGNNTINSSEVMDDDFTVTHSWNN